jgi:PleD family two-component response regulator
VGKVAVPVTVSGGVAVLGGSTLDAALKAADLALYTAKSDGRDQMRLAA